MAMAELQDAVIVSAVRTAIGIYGGGLAEVPAVKLGEICIRAALERADLKPGQVNEVIMGNVLQAGLGQNPARQAAINAGLPVEIPALTINKVCGSGLKAVALAAQAVKLGDADIVVAGGMESMSRAPYVVEKARFGYRMGDGQLVDEMIRDGLWDAFNSCHMGITAENICSDCNLTREELDEFALQSQQKATQAIANGVFRDVIEANEAFAAQSVAVGKELGFDRSKLNISGGAIALGHPIGASGTRVLITLLYGMQRQQAHYGLTTLCIGGGQGVAMIVER